jgi:hypothetical protein
LDIREDANGVVLNSDMFKIANIRKVDTDMLDVICVVAANFVKELSYKLKVVLGEVEAILSVKQRASWWIVLLAQGSFG